jgi:hypothetical protein
MGLLTSLLPRRVRGYIEAGEVLFADLDTQAERDAVLKYIAEMGQDGKVGVGEWAQLGSMIKILGKNHKKKRA